MSCDVLSVLQTACTGCRAGRRRRVVPGTKLLAGLGNEFQQEEEEGRRREAGVKERIPLLEMGW